MHRPARRRRSSIGSRGEIKTIVERPDFKARVENSGATIYYMGPEQLTEYTKQEVAHWSDVVRNLGIPAQSQ